MNKIKKKSMHWLKNGTQCKLYGMYGWNYSAHVTKCWCTSLLIQLFLNNNSSLKLSSFLRTGKKYVKFTERMLMTEILIGFFIIFLYNMQNNQKLHKLQLQSFQSFICCQRHVQVVEYSDTIDFGSVFY